MASMKTDGDRCRQTRGRAACVASPEMNVTVRLFLHKKTGSERWLDGREEGWPVVLCLGA